MPHGFCAARPGPMGVAHRGQALHRCNDANLLRRSRVAAAAPFLPRAAYAQQIERVRRIGVLMGLCNFPALRAFHHHVTHLWLRTLQRRSQKDRTTW